MDQHRYYESDDYPPQFGYDQGPLPEEPQFRQSAARVDRGERTIELKEEQLFATKELREVGEIIVRTEVEEFPGQLEVEAFREEAQVEHVPVGQIVSERLGSWEENGVLVVPIYEEQLVVVKRLVLKEHVRVRRVGVTERQVFQDMLRRDRLVIDDPGNTGLVHESYPVVEDADLEPQRSAPGPADERVDQRAAGDDRRGPVNSLFRKVLM